MKIEDSKVLELIYNNQKMIGNLKEVKKLVDEIIEVLKDLEDSNECQFDHHGNCQQHGWIGDRECPQARLKRILRREKMK